jgi:hypothetical protein
MFSEMTMALLRRAGWSEDRRVDTTKYEKMMKEEGYLLLPNAIDFLSCFGGLVVSHPSALGTPDKEEFHFDPILANQQMDAEGVQEYSHRAGVPLTIVGECYRRMMTLLMDSDGKIYAAVDNTLVRIGQSWSEAIEILCSGKPRGVRIP